MLHQWKEDGTKEKINGELNNVSGTCFGLEKFPTNDPN